MSKMTKFTNIGQMRGIIKAVRHECEYGGLDENGETILKVIPEGGYPTLKFEFSEKLHGSNGSLVFTKDEMYIQSRNNIITIGNDNAGFANFILKNKEVCETIRNDYSSLIELNKSVAIYGEWCGGNIQKNVGINGLDKMFVIFAIKIIPNDEDTEPYYLKLTKNDFNAPIFKDNLFFNIQQFETRMLDIDFNNPDKATEILVKWVDEIENESFVAKYFGIENGIGEGWVGTYHENGIRKHIFKIKGEKHCAGGGKIKKLRMAEKLDPKVQVKIENFVNTNACQEFRLDQMFQEANDTINGGESSMKNMGIYLKKVNADIIKEESDVLADLGIDWKLISKSVMNIAKAYYINRLNSEAGL